ncbi:unnamed protein product [Gordionus sp. m RMFG-2023]
MDNATFDNPFSKLAYNNPQPCISLESFIDADFVIGALLDISNPTLLPNTYECGRDDKMMIQSYSMLYTFR